MKRPIVTYALIALNVAAFAFELARGADALSPTPHQLLALGASYAPLTLDGEPWRLVTSMFLHFGLLHLAVNMVSLYQGRLVELLFGRAGFVAIYLVAGLVGGVASVLHHGNVVSAGASGAVFGVFGAFGVFLFAHRARATELGFTGVGRRLIMIFAINLVIGFTSPVIDLSAHLGGLIAGAAVAAVLVRDGRRGLRAGLAIVVGVALAGLAITVIPPPTDQIAPLDAFDRIVPQSTAEVARLLADVSENKLTPGEAADRLDNELLPRWRALRTQQAAVHATGRIAKLYAASLRYLELRQLEWEQLAAALHEPDDQARADKLNAIGPARDAANAAHSALAHEIELANHARSR